MSPLDFDIDDPSRADVAALIARHRAYAHAHTPPEAVFALDTHGLNDPAVTLFSARRAGELLGICALKHLEPSHAELKSMHTAEHARGQGVAIAMVGHLLATARARGYRRVSLETGAAEPFRPARALYARCGFTACGPFGDYTDSTTSAFMTIAVVGW